MNEIENGMCGEYREFKKWGVKKKKNSLKFK